MKTWWSCSRPDDVGEVGGDEQMCNFGVERVPGEECGRPVCVIVVQGAVVCWGAAEVSFEFGRGCLQAFNWVCKVLAVWAREIVRI